ncbi:hypothetical protein, partial [Streptomyces sp. DT17]
MGHGPLVNLIDGQRAASACGAGARTLQFSAFSCDASFQEMFSTWAAATALDRAAGPGRNAALSRQR